MGQRGEGAKDCGLCYRTIKVMTFDMQRQAGESRVEQQGRIPNEQQCQLVGGMFADAVLVVLLLLLCSCERAQEQLCGIGLLVSVNQAASYFSQSVSPRSVMFIFYTE